MGMHSLGMMQAVTEMRVLAETSEDALRTAEMRGRADEHVALSMQDRVKKMQKMMENINYHWSHLPGEWDQR